MWCASWPYTEGKHTQLHSINKNLNVNFNAPVFVFSLVGLDAGQKVNPFLCPKGLEHDI